MKDLKLKHPGAKYVASIRHSWGQCHRFENLYKLASYVVYGKYKSSAEPPGRHSSIVLLDRHFCIIEIARQVFVEEMDRPNSVGWLAEDVRLLLYDNRILATAVMSSENGKYFQHDFKQRFVVQELIPEIQGDLLTARFVAAPSEIYPQLINYTVVSNARNLGLLVLDGTLMFLTFLGLQAEMQSNLLPLPELPSTLPLLGHFGKWLHNNVNPLVINDLNMFLVVGHEHEHEKRDKIFKTTSWHTYLHYFLIFNTTSPYHLIARSPAFCFSHSPQGKCDLIQFVSSLTWASSEDLHRAGYDVVVGYGINDCEGVFAKLPLRSILEFTIGCGLDWRLRAAANYISHSFQLQTQIQFGDVH